MARRQLREGSIGRIAGKTRTIVRGLRRDAWRKPNTIEARRRMRHRMQDDLLDYYGVAWEVPAPVEEPI